MAQQDCRPAAASRRPLGCQVIGQQAAPAPVVQRGTVRRPAAGTTLQIASWPARRIINPHSPIKARAAIHCCTAHNKPIQAARQLGKPPHVRALPASRHLFVEVLGFGCSSCRCRLALAALPGRGAAAAGQQPAQLQAGQGSQPGWSSCE